METCNFINDNVKSKNVNLPASFEVSFIFDTRKKKHFSLVLPDSSIKTRSASLMHTVTALLLLSSGVAQLVRVPPFQSKDSEFQSRCLPSELGVIVVQDYTSVTGSISGMDGDSLIASSVELFLVPCDLLS